MVVSAIASTPQGVCPHQTCLPKRRNKNSSGKEDENRQQQGMEGSVKAGRH
ncbi:integrase from phage origin domain protein [Shigella flexneri 1235-66]|nr:integrase from phage origin domain protein [Shigella flexneri 1235-66]